MDDDYEGIAWDCCLFFAPDISDEDQYFDLDVEDHDWQVIALDRFSDRVLIWQLTIQSKANMVEL